MRRPLPTPSPPLNHGFGPKMGQVDGHMESRVCYHGTPLLCALQCPLQQMHVGPHERGAAEAEAAAGKVGLGCARGKHA